MPSLHPLVEALFERLEASHREDGKKPLFAEGVPVYIYGAGNVGKDIFRLLAARGTPVAAFLDRNAKPGSRWEEIPILLPNDPTIPADARKQNPVVIGIFNGATEILPVRQLLHSLGYEQVTPFLDFHARFAPELGDRFWLTAREFYPAEKEKISAAFELFSDEGSRDLYAAMLEFRTFNDATAVPAPNPADQYFPPDLPAWPSPVRFVDCGAFDGDTLRQMAERQLPIEAIAAFEPDRANFQKLAQTAGSLIPNGKGTTILFPCGVSSTTSQIRFSSGQGTASCASESGDTIIQCVALDEALAGFRPNLIKMDIEGAEVDALRGAQRVIEKNRPGLAICVYHRPDHLWTIPLLVNTWVKGGRHYLRAHAHNGFELVYYWVP